MSLCNVPLQANEKEFNQQDNETDDLFLNFILDHKPSCISLSFKSYNKLP